jgi:hypothetical protein
LACDDGAYSNKLCANVYVNPLHHLAMQQCAELPWELVDHTPGSDTVLMLLIL